MILGKTEALIPDFKVLLPYLPLREGPACSIRHDTVPQSDVGRLGEHGLLSALCVQSRPEVGTSSPGRFFSAVWQRLPGHYVRLH